MQHSERKLAWRQDIEADLGVSDSSTSVIDYFKEEMKKTNKQTNQKPEDYAFLSKSI